MRSAAVALCALLLLAPGCTAKRAAGVDFGPAQPAPDDPRLVNLTQAQFDALPAKVRDAIGKAAGGERASVDLTREELARMDAVVTCRPGLLRWDGAYVGCVVSRLYD